MAILKVAKMGHPVLRQVAEALTREELLSAPIQLLIDNMIETMVEYEGVGLAAPQVHESIRLFVMDVPEAGHSERYPDTGDGYPLTVVANPEIAFLDDESFTMMEGCLSIPEILGSVTRPANISLRYLDRDGNAVERDLRGFPAIVAQHETDHLDGILYLDRMESMASLAFRREYDRYHDDDDE